MPPPWPLVIRPAAWETIADLAAAGDPSFVPVLALILSLPGGRRPEGTETLSEGLLRASASGVVVVWEDPVATGAVTIALVYRAR